MEPPAGLISSSASPTAKVIEQRKTFMAFSYDHRIIDGVLANSFLWRVADNLNRAEFEV